MHYLKKSRRLSLIKRWAIMPILQDDTVAAHSYRVAMLVRWLIVMNPGISTEREKLDILKRALDHDLNEAVEGDPPGGPMKKQKDWSKYYAENGHYSIIKLADLMDAGLFLKEEMDLGNKQVASNYAWYKRQSNLLAEVIGGWRPEILGSRLFQRVESLSTGFTMDDYNVD